MQRSSMRYLPVPSSSATGRDVEIAEGECTVTRTASVPLTSRPAHEASHWNRTTDTTNLSFQQTAAASEGEKNRREEGFPTGAVDDNRY